MPLQLAPVTPQERDLYLENLGFLDTPSGIEAVRLVATDLEMLRAEQHATAAQGCLNSLAAMVIALCTIQTQIEDESIDKARTLDAVIPLLQQSRPLVALIARQAAALEREQWA